MQRRDVHFSGNVQGVGFRATTQHVARGFDVTGFVQNLPDGRVRMVVEGEAKELDAMIAAVEERMSGHIRETATDNRPATGEFSNFGVRY